MNIRKLFIGVAIALSMAGVQAQTSKQCLDSIVSPQNSKNTYSYDSRGNITLSVDYFWENNNWKSSYKSESMYDNNGNQTMYANYQWNYTTNNWSGFYKHEHTYDNNGNRTRYINYIWDNATKDWVRSNKYEYIEDNQTVTYQWDNLTNTWTEIGKTRHEYTYDSNKHLILQNSYSWNNTNGWEISSKCDYLYDDNGNQTMSASYYRENNTWIGSYKEESTYDENGNKTMMTYYYQWNYTKSDWIGDNRYEYTYDEANNQTIEVYFLWDDATTEWKKVWKDDYTYDNNGNNTMVIKSGWENNEWTKQNSSEYLFDLSYSKTDLIMPNFSSFFANNMAVERTDYSWFGTTKVETGISTYYWSVQNVGIVETDNYPSLQVYPNPTNGQLRISVPSEGGVNTAEDIQIYDIVGKMVMTHNIPLTPFKGGMSSASANSPFEGGRGMSEIVIDVSHLASGLYYLRIENRTVKVIKN